MYRRILVPIDGSDIADDALDHALELAAAVDADIAILYVADTAHDSVTVVGTDVIDALVREGETVVSTAEERAEARGVPVDGEVMQGSPAETILDFIESREADLVVMGTQGRTGLSRALLGSVTERVVRNATVPVLTVGLGAVEDS